MRIIALDIGNVCVRLTPNRCLESLGFAADAAIPVEVALCIDKMERGLASQGEWLEVLRRHTGMRHSDNELRAAYNLILGEELAETAAFLRGRVAQGYMVVFFSDTSRAHLNWIYRNLSFANIVTGGVFSFETGAKKPEPRMYEAFEQKYGIPELYLDDMPKNIEAAEKRGWNAVLFNTPEILAKIPVARVSAGSDSRC